MELDGETAPSTNAWSAIAVRASVRAPGGATQRSWCHWNHGPASTRSGSSVSTRCHPISTSGDATTAPPRAVASA